MGEVKFVERVIGEFHRRNQHLHPDSIAIDVSSRGGFPFNQLSPCTYSKRIMIPVPGMKKCFSHSVEGVWQGLKIINGLIDKNMFKKRPKRRTGRVQGYKYGERTINLLDARKYIYVPSYFDYLDDFASKKAINFILNGYRLGKTFLLYDVNSNWDMTCSKPMAHAAMLSAYLNLKIMNQKILPLNEAEKKLFRILDARKTNEEKVDLIFPLIGVPAIKKAFIYRCVEHPANPDDFHIAEFFKKYYSEKLI
jgi:hypothetical protein